ncbi:hypothetical protein J4E81_006702 [Alternaria sp. BMP 2799]|nr:hypothetical protein J4E81_006702 [Alternaria sp. BMP 2799]
MLATSATACRVTTDPVQPSISSPFLRLPRELRDEIYDHYFRTDDGFTYDFVTNKLKLAGGLPIPLALTLTCRQIHDEVQGLALTLNAIEFTTSFHEATRQPAALYHAAHNVTQDRKLNLVNDLAPQLLSADMARIATNSYPQFAPVVNLWRSQRTLRYPKTSWGEPPSIWRDFITFVLSLIAKDPRFVELAHTALRSYHGCDGRSPGIPLQLRKWLAAAELKDLPLTYNTIHFSTVYHENARSRVGLFAALVEVIQEGKAEWLADAYACIDSSITSNVEQNFPGFLPVLEAFQRRQTTRHLMADNFKETRSMYREFVNATLRLVSQHPDFADAFAGHPTKGPEFDRFAGLLATNVAPWSTPDEAAIARMIDIVGGEPHRFGGDWDRDMFRVSAASAAIKFLDGLPLEKRLRLRTIVLLEDRVAVAWPESHARGLIPFCLENNSLRIERRVSLWRAIFPAGSISPRVVAAAPPITIRRDRIDRLRFDEVTRLSVASWIMEAMALPGYGMPEGAFTLTLDGEPTLRKSYEVFDMVVQRDAAWQIAFERYCDKRSDIPRWSKVRGNDGYVTRGFPQVLRDITAGNTTLVRANFDLGDEWNIGRFEREGRDWTLSQWEHHQYNHKVMDFQTDAPLPSWLDLRLEDVLPE